MSQLDDRAALLDAVRSLRDDLAAIVFAGADQAAPSRADDTWTFNDHLAHLTSWRLLTAARLEAALRGEEPHMPWPAPLTEEDDLDEINRFFFTSNRDKPRAALIGESDETFARIERALTQLPEAALFEVGRFPWLAGYALGPAVIEGAVDHFREHEMEMRGLLAQGDGS